MTFTLSSSSGIDYYFGIPEWAGVENSFTKDLQVINFWTNTLSTVDKGLYDEPLVLHGKLNRRRRLYTNADTGVCFPLCFPLCFPDWFADMYENFNNDMNNGCEFTISELGDCINGVYVVKDFEIRTVDKNPYYYDYTLTLERVRDI